MFHAFHYTPSYLYMTRFTYYYLLIVDASMIDVSVVSLLLSHVFHRLAKPGRGIQKGNRRSTTV